MDCGIYGAVQKFIVAINILCRSNESYVTEFLFHTFRNIMLWMNELEYEQRAGFISAQSIKATDEGAVC